MRPGTPAAQACSRAGVAGGTTQAGCQVAAPALPQWAPARPVPPLQHPWWSTVPCCWHLASLAAPHPGNSGPSRRRATRGRRRACGGCRSTCARRGARRRPQGACPWWHRQLHLAPCLQRAASCLPARTRLPRPPASAPRSGSNTDVAVWRRRAGGESDVPPLWISTMPPPSSCDGLTLTSIHSIHTSASLALSARVISVRATSRAPAALDQCLPLKGQEHAFRHAAMIAGPRVTGAWTRVEPARRSDARCTTFRLQSAYLVHWLQSTPINTARDPPEAVLGPHAAAPATLCPFPRCNSCIT